MESQRGSTYIERLARDIWEATGETEPWYPAEEASLWLGYALLARTKGKKTTSQDVHDAWSAWAVIRYAGHHRSLIPFDELEPEVQAYDDLYRDAIHFVCSPMATCAICGVSFHTKVKPGRHNRSFCPQHKVDGKNERKREWARKKAAERKEIA